MTKEKIIALLVSGCMLISLLFALPVGASSSSLMGSEDFNDQNPNSAFFQAQGTGDTLVIGNVLNISIPGGGWGGFFPIESINYAYYMLAEVTALYDASDSAGNLVARYSTNQTANRGLTACANQYDHPATNGDRGRGAVYFILSQGVGAINPATDKKIKIRLVDKSTAAVTDIVVPTPTEVNFSSKTAIKLQDTKDLITLYAKVGSDYVTLVTVDTVNKKVIDYQNSSQTYTTAINTVGTPAFGAHSQRLLVDNVKLYALTCIALEAKIAEAGSLVQSDYLSGWANLQNAIQAGQALLQQDGDVTAQQANDAVAAIDNAIDGLASTALLMGSEDFDDQNPNSTFFQANSNGDTKVVDNVLSISIPGGGWGGFFPIQSINYKYYMLADVTAQYDASNSAADIVARYPTNQTTNRGLTACANQYDHAATNGDRGRGAVYFILSQGQGMINPAVDKKITIRLVDKSTAAVTDIVVPTPNDVNFSTKTAIKLKDTKDLIKLYAKDNSDYVNIVTIDTLNKKVVDYQNNSQTYTTTINTEGTPAFGSNGQQLLVDNVKVYTMTCDALKNKIAESGNFVESDYISGWAALQSAIQAGQLLLQQAEITTQQSDDAVTAINNGIDGLVSSALLPANNEYVDVFNENFNTALTAAQIDTNWIAPFRTAGTDAYMFAGDSYAKLKWSSDGVFGNGSILATAKSYQNYKLETNVKVVNAGNFAALSLRNPTDAFTITELREGGGTERPGLEGIMLVLAAPDIASNEFAIVFKNGQRSTKAEYLIKYPTSVNITGDTAITIYDLDNEVYIYMGGVPVARIELVGLTGENYTSGSVYNSKNALVGASFSGMVIKRGGHVGYSTRVGEFAVNDVTISGILNETQAVTSDSFDKTAWGAGNSAGNKAKVEFIAGQGYNVTISVKVDKSLGRSTIEVKDKDGNVVDSKKIDCFFVTSSWVSVTFTVPSKGKYTLEITADGANYSDIADIRFNEGLGATTAGNSIVFDSVVINKGGI